MSRFVEEADRGQWTLLPECLDDFIDERNPVRVIDVFIDALDLAEMRFEGVEPAATVGPRTTHRFSLSFTFTAICTGFSRAGGSNERPDAMSRSCGCWVGSRLIARRSRTSARTTAWRFARSVRALSNSPVNWARAILVQKNFHHLRFPAEEAIASADGTLQRFSPICCT